MDLRKFLTVKNFRYTQLIHLKEIVKREFMLRCNINKKTNEILANQVIAESTDNRIESYPSNGKDYLCPLFNH